jgi:hypothetical protein
MDENLDKVVAAIQVALKVLGARFLTLLALLMTFGLFAWAMFQATWLHFAIAAAFGIVIFLPVLWHGRTGDQNVN